MMWNTDTWLEMERLRRDMDGLFRNYAQSGGASTFPLTNVYESNDDLVISAELPGMTKEKVNITFSDGVLTIAGKGEPPSRTKDMAVIRRERAGGEFEKSLRIPTKVEADEISASFTDGVLRIQLPKAEEAKPKSITIEAK